MLSGEWSLMLMSKVEEMTVLKTRESVKQTQVQLSGLTFPFDLSKRPYMWSLTCSCNDKVPNFQMQVLQALTGLSGSYTRRSTATCFDIRCTHLSVRRCLHQSSWGRCTSEGRRSQSENVRLDSLSSNDYCGDGIVGVGVDYNVMLGSDFETLV
jgi:hypothetical protein